MFSLEELKELLKEYGPMRVIAHDRSGLRRAVVYDKQPVDDLLDKINNLKDGPETWIFSIFVEPSR